MNSLFIEGFLARLLPAAKETTLQASLHFHPETYAVDAAIASLGALLASAVLYAVGIWLRRLPQKISSDSQQQKIARMKAVATEWLPWLLLLSPTPVGGMLVLAAGFFAIRPRVAALAIVAGEVLWRASPLLNG